MSAPNQTDRQIASQTGQLIGIARRPGRRTRMEIVEHGEIRLGAGLVGDHKGDKFPARGITILAAEDWAAAVAEIAGIVSSGGVNHDSPQLFPVNLAPLNWTARRANLLVAGIRLPRACGAVLSIGEIRLEVTAQTYPCRRMDEVHPGLLKALAKDWRGGVSCRVITGGNVNIGDAAGVEASPGERIVRLPG